MFANSATIVSRASILLVLVPTVCCANGWVSGVNAFRTTPDFYFIFVAIVLVEWVILSRSLRSVTAFGALWRVLAVNIVSSLAGDILFRIGWAPSSGTVWVQAVPFFILTVAVELPLLLLLLRQRESEWRVVSLIALAANVASYALLIVLDAPVRGAWLRRIHSADQKIVGQWTNTLMFAEAKGRLYATESVNGGPPHRLRHFSFTDHRWHSVSNSPAVHPNIWDIEGDLLAYQTYGESSSRHLVRITTLPECNRVRDLELPSSGYPGAAGGEVAISPDGTKLAVLVPLHEIRIPLSGSSYRFFGASCLTVIYDLKTGTRTIGPRRALRTIRWMPDSDRLLFEAPADQELLANQTVPNQLRKRYRLEDPEESPFYNPSVFSYRPATAEVTVVPGIADRLVAAQAGQAFGWSNAYLTMLNLTNQTRRSIFVDSLSWVSDPILSPDNRFVVASFQLNRFASHYGYPAVVDLKQPSRRYHLGRVFYRLDWTSTPASIE